MSVRCRLAFASAATRYGLLCGGSLHVITHRTRAHRLDLILPADPIIRHHYGRGTIMEHFR